MRLSVFEIYAINHMNESEYTPFGIPKPNDKTYTEILQQGYDSLREKKQFSEDSMTDELVEQAYILDKWLEYKEFLIIDDLMFGFSKENPGGIAIKKIEDEDEYEVTPIGKGHLLMTILLSIPFLQKDKEVEEHQMKASPMQMGVALGKTEAFRLQYHKNDSVVYNKVIIDFYDRVVEYDEVTQVVKSLSALSLRKKIVEWTKAGSELDGNRFKFR